MAYGTLTVGAQIDTASGGTNLLTMPSAVFNDAAAAEWVWQRTDAVVGGGTTVDTSTLVGTIITTLIVVNRDGANEVDVDWDDDDGNNNVQVVPAGGILVIPNVDAAVAPVLIGQVGTVTCDVFYMGT